MEKTGLLKLSIEDSKTVYTYVWQFGKNIATLKKWASLVGQDKLESDAIIFDTGILQKTKHSMKAYFIISKKEVIVKARLGKPSLCDQYTCSDITLKNVRFSQYSSVYPYYTLKGDPHFKKATNKCLKTHYLKSTWDKSDMAESAWHHRIFWDCKGNVSLTIRFDFEHTFWRDETMKTTSGGNQLMGVIHLPPVTTLDTTSLYQTKQLTDFVIHCGDSNFKAHKIVLAMRSPVFAAMLEQPLSENIEGKMTIKDATPKSVEEFLKFLYIGTADFEKYASELVLISDKYGVNNLKQLCEYHLLNTVTVENVLDLYNLGELANSEELKKTCIDVIKRNKKEMFKTADEAAAFLLDFPFAYGVVFD